MQFVLEVFTNPGLADRMTSNFQSGWAEQSELKWCLLMGRADEQHKSVAPGRQKINRANKIKRVYRPDIKI